MSSATPAAGLQIYAEFTCAGTCRAHSCVPPPVQTMLARKTVPAATSSCAGGVHPAVEFVFGQSPPIQIREFVLAHIVIRDRLPARLHIDVVQFGRVQPEDFFLVLLSDGWIS